MSWVFIFRWIPKHNNYWGWKVLQYTCGEDFEEVGSNFAFCVVNIQHGNSVLHRRWVENELLLIICFLCCPACLSIVTQVPRRKKALLPFRLLPFWFYRRPCCHLVRIKLSAEGAKRDVETIPNDIHSPMAKGHPGPSMSKGLDESFNNDDDCNFLVISTLYILEWSWD